jgi:hypothetical protein
MHMAKLVDSGERREFKSGAVRDLAEGKGRMDLVPLDAAAKFLNRCREPDEPGKLKPGAAALVLTCLNNFIDSCRSGKPEDNHIYEAMDIEARVLYDDPYTAIMEVSKQYEDGAKKYCERNWEKGIPVHCYIDSAARHLMKVGAGWDDENHSRAALWNLFSLAWTVKHHPELLQDFVDELK